MDRLENRTGQVDLLSLVADASGQSVKMTPLEMCAQKAN